MHSLICDFCSSDQRFARELVGSPHPASFRFHLTMNTLAFGYILPTTGWIPDFHRLETCTAGRTVKKPVFRKSRRRAIIPWYHFYSLIPDDISLIVRNNRRSRQSLAFDCSCIYLQFVSATPKPSSIRFPSFPLSLTGNFSVKILLMYFLFPSVFYIIVYPNNNRFIRICKVARS